MPKGTSFEIFLRSRACIRPLFQLHSLLCYFANDDKIGAKKKLQSFSLDAVSFETSRQYTLLEQMLEHIEKNEKEEY